MKGPASIRPTFQTMNRALAQAATHASGLTFVDAREQDTFLPWQEVLSRAMKVAGALHARGVRPGDRVAIVLPTSPSFCDAFFGALFAGAVPVPLYPPVRLGRLEEYHRATARMLSAAGARIVVTERRIGLLLGKPVAAARPGLGMCTAAELLQANASPLHVEVGADDLALIQFSSGSTSDPRPVALTHRALLAQTAVLKNFMEGEPEIRPVGVSWLPLYHDMGLIGCLLVAAYWPGHLILIPPEVFLARPAIWLRTISRFRAKISPAPNFAFGLCVKRIRDEELEGLDLSSWTFAPCGAESISIPVLERFSERFSRVGFKRRTLVPAYGLAEAALAVTFARGNENLSSTRIDAGELARTGVVREGSRSVASVGRPIPGFEVELRNELGLPVDPGEVGRIHVRGPSLMSGYFDAPEATAKVLTEGWLDTGDLGFERNGELFVTGRAKDVIIVRGANHVPQEFEECVDGMPGVRAGCVAATGFLPPDGSGEELLLLVERTDEAPEDLGEQIRGAVTERTGIRPHTIALLEPGTLPRTSSGKIRRSEAHRRYVAGELRPPNKVRAVGLVLEMARSLAAQAFTR